MKKMLAQYYWYVWAILGGSVYTLCFPQYDLIFLSLLMLPFLRKATENIKTIKQALICGFLHSTMLAVLGFHWLVYLGQNFGDLNFVQALGLLGLYCVASSPHMYVFYVLAFWGHRKWRHLNPNLQPLIWAGLFTVLEFSSRYLKVFPENLGNTMLNSLPLAQAASVGGVSLLTFLPLYLGASLDEVVRNRRKAVIALACSTLLIAGFYLWGTRELKRWDTMEARTTLKVGIVQHNMEDVEKLVLFTGAREALRKVVYELLDLTTKLVRENPGVDLVVWPETAYPITFPGKENSDQGGLVSYGYSHVVKEKIRELKVPLLFGGYENANLKDYNSVFYLNNRGELLDVYRKNILLFGGEYIPLADEFPIIKSINPQLGGFGRGKGPFPLSYHDSVKDIRLGVNICYEAIIPAYMRDLVRNGANLLVNITKDSWYGDTFEPWQHFQLSVMRSIEHRVPMIRATNTGLSGLVSPSGRTQILSLPFHRAVSVISVPLPKESSPTFYTQWGEWLVLLLSIFLVSITLYLQKFV